MCKGRTALALINIILESNGFLICVDFTTRLWSRSGSDGLWLVSIISSIRYCNKISWRLDWRFSDVSRVEFVGGLMMPPARVGRKQPVLLEHRPWKPQIYNFLKSVYVDFSTVLCSQCVGCRYRFRMIRSIQMNVENDIVCIYYRYYIINS